MGSFEQMPSSYFESGKKKVVSLPEGVADKGILKYGDKRWHIDPKDMESDDFLFAAYEAEETDITLSEPDGNGDCWYEISVPEKKADAGFLEKAERSGWKSDFSGNGLVLFEKKKGGRISH